MDPRLRLAVDTSRAWYDDLLALHGVPTGAEDGLWWARAAPPAYHSAAKTLVPRVPAERVLEAVAPLPACSVADSFGDLDLPGFTLLFEATWLHHPGGRSRGMPASWSVVTTPDALVTWCALHDYAGVLPSGVLDHPRFTVLGRHEAGPDGRLVGGAVLHDAGPGVGLSNAWSADDGHDWDELLAAACAVHPDRPLTDYAGGDDLAVMCSAGFAELGPQVVWLREPPGAGSSA
jgi:hypothetical protein